MQMYVNNFEQIAFLDLPSFLFRDFRVDFRIWAQHDLGIY